MVVTVEHLLCIGVTIYSIIIYQSDKHILTELIRSLVPHLVPRNEPLPTFLALLICFINESATFVWNFLDIFLMFVGIGLSTHFKLFNNEMERAANEIEVKLMKIKIIFLSKNELLLLLLCYFRFYRIYRLTSHICECSIQNCVNWLQQSIKEYHI